MKRLMAAALLATVCGCDRSNGNLAEPEENPASNQTPVSNETGVQTGAATPGTVHFVNSRANALSDSLRRSFVDFSFDYPSSWTVTPPRRDGTERNYVRVAAPPVEGFEPFSFHVGLATGSGDAARDRRDIEQALPQVAEQFGAGLDNYRVASVGRARVGPYDSWNWRFSATAPAETGRRPIRINGRGDIVLPPGAARGVLIISLVTDQSDELTTPAQAGETGTLKALYDSFRLGRTPRQETSRPVRPNR